MQWRAAHEFLTLPPHPSAEFKSQKLFKLCLWLNGKMFHASEKKRKKKLDGGVITCVNDREIIPIFATVDIKFGI